MTEPTEQMLDCFGSVMLYAAESPYCSACPMRDSCAAQVAEVSAELSKLAVPADTTSKTFWRGSVSASRAKRAAAKAASAPPTTSTARTSEAKATVAAVVAHLAKPLNKKPQERLEAWEKRAIVLNLLTLGRNPFEGLAGVLVERAFVDVYLEANPNVGAQPVLIPRDTMLAELGKRLKKADGTPWSAASVASNFNIVRDALEARGYKMVGE